MVKPRYIELYLHYCLTHLGAQLLCKISNVGGYTKDLRTLISSKITR